MKKILLFLFIFLIKKIYSISGTEEDGKAPSSTGSSQDFKVDLNNACPCDITEGVCDFGCCCDKDCLQFMFDQDYYDKFSECDSSSSFKTTIRSKLDYCGGHKKSVDDLYNPLTLAFKILKKGFCKAKNQNPEEEDDTNNQNNNEDSEEKKDNQKNDNNDIFGINENIPQKSFNLDSKGEFEKLDFYVPITLASGMCLFGYYRIMKYQDYEVTCSYNENQNNLILDYYSTVTHSYLVENNYYTDAPEGEILPIKKIEIIYFLSSNEFEINHYYTSNSNSYRDLTFVVKFLNDKSDYHKSGNPGYIKGNPILLKKNFANNNNLEHYLIYTIFPIEEHDQNCVDTINEEKIYFDNYFDNRLTFEDFTIYGYGKTTEGNNNRVCYKNIYNNILKIYDKKFGKFGSANIRYEKDWKEFNIINEEIDFNVQFIFGAYKSVGTVNNTQFEIYEMNLHNRTHDDNDIFYFISKFEKLKIETEWWYAYGPGFIRLPKNIMYPFRIGTTRYSQS